MTTINGNKNFTATIELEKSSRDVFKAITADLSKWWGGKDFKGSSTKLNDEFTIIHEDIHYSKQKLIEVIPNNKIVWLVTESKLNWLEKDKYEWTNTKLIFQITHDGSIIKIKFIHEGLVPEKECYSRCEQG